MALSFFVSLGSLLFVSDSVQAQGVDFIEITDAPDGNPINDMTYLVGDNDTYYCSGYNWSIGYVGLQICSWYSEDWPIINLSPWNNTNFTFANAAGSGITTVWATHDDGDPTGPLVDYTGALTVAPDGVDYIVVMYADDGGTGQLKWVGDVTYHLGDWDYFYSLGFNNTTGEIGQVRSNWTTTNSVVCGITSTPAASMLFTAKSMGTCTVTAEYLGKSNDTGTITVTHKLDYIVITDSPNGTPIGDMEYNLGHNDTFYCSGYNYTEGYMGLENCYWDSKNVTIGVVEPRQGESTLFTTKGFGTTIVTASRYHPGQNFTMNTTGMLNVVADNVNSIVIVDSPINAKWVGDTTYNIGDEDTFYSMAYNDTQGLLGLIPANWTTTNSTVCNIGSFGTESDFNALRHGTCKVKAEYKGIYFNETGTLNVTKGSMITVDDDLPADYKTIQEAVDAANPGDTIFVYAGTYPEHVIVNKTVTLKGEDEEKVIVTGGGSGKVFEVTANGVSIFHFTIRDAKYGVYAYMTDRLVMDYNIVTNYTTGLYFYKTTDSWVTYNDISYGEYGIEAYYVYDDAFRYNDISYNTKYGAKGYDVQLKNCFNWNYFYKNKVGYWYDPDEPLDTLEFDGNILEDNEIGIKVNGSSTINLTNNTLINNDIGIYILEASPLIMSNSLNGNRIGIYCEDSSSLMLDNSISGSDRGIYCVDASPLIKENEITDSSEYDLYLDGSTGTVEDSEFEDVSLVDSELESISSTFADVELDSDSVLTAKWRLTVQVLDENNHPIPQATVWIYDGFGLEVGSLATMSNGRTDEILVTQKVDTSDGSDSYNPFTISAEKDELVGELEAVIEQDRQLSIILLPPAKDAGFWIPFELLIVMGSAIVIGAGIGAFLASEGFKIALVSLILPLYMKLKKGKVLDNYDRGRVYQYIEINPGEHYNQIKRDLSLPNGSLVHHLGILEKAGRIKSRRDGRFRRFYTRGTQIPVTNGGTLTEVQKRITDSLKDLPGITQKEMASLLGVHQSSVSYQMSKLEERGLIRAEKKGRKVHYYYVGK
jgi:DNA-binding MarR family transcriptional regulator/nitrous oxidase accessory protein NosD